MTQEKFCDKSYFLTKKNTPKGALCKYSHSFEERLLNCEALRAFLRPGFYNRCYLAIIFSLFQDLLLKKP